MGRVCLVLNVVVCMTLALAAAGCSEPAAPPPAAPVKHDHAKVGPHGGPLTELGDDQYHAELVHDEQAGTVTIYLLDSKAQAAVAIEAADVTINIKHDGAAEQFRLAASRQADDPDGKSSRFTSSDKELAEELEHAGGALVVTIEGEQYRGAIAMEHDGHSHQH